MKFYDNRILRMEVHIMKIYFYFMNKKRILKMFKNEKIFQKFLFEIYQLYCINFFFNLGLLIIFSNNLTFEILKIIKIYKVKTIILTTIWQNVCRNAKLKPKMIS